MVTGTLGASAAGWRLLESGADDSATGPLLRAAHLRPNPRLAVGHVLHEAGVTAAMDLSDGLLGDLPKILAASGVSARIEIDRLPVLPAVQALFPRRWQEFALRGGEDYELLMTLPPDRLAILHDLTKHYGATVTAIGTITDGSPPSMELWSGNERATNDVDPGAWDHFAST
mgnify:CR=1 FL=1